jgi:biopolymer transport protein ExbB
MKKTLALGALIALVPSFANAWWDAAWTARRTVTLDTGATGVTIAAPQSSVPVAIRLHSGNFDFTAAKEDGSDLRFVAGDDKTVLKHHVERFDALNELAVVWVQVPLVTPGQDKAQIYAYFGNTAATGAQDSKATYDSSTVGVWHFSETALLADSSASGLVATGTVAVQKAALLGDAAIFNGSALRVAAAPQLATTAGGAWSASAWIVPSSLPQQATLYAQGSLTLKIEGSALVLTAGGVRVAGGTLKPGTWQHVAATVGGGKATIYVDGQAVGSGDATLGAQQAEVVIGDGYSGELDELQLANTARSADWVKLAAAGQGADANFVTVREDAAEAGEGGGHNYFGILLDNLTTDAWVVIIILAVMFVISVWVMIAKALLVGRIDGDNRRFLGRFRTATSEFLTLDQGAAHPDSSLFRLYGAGLREIRKRFDSQGEAAGLTGASMDAIKASIDADLVRESHKLNSQMVLLTIAISGGPFLGLLGTVVGVMITFAAIAAAGDVNVNAIAPGIAAALLATVAGLAVAIPALFGYNYLASRIKNISADMQIFVDEFVTRVAEVHGR